MLINFDYLGNGFCYDVFLASVAGLNYYFLDFGMKISVYFVYCGFCYYYDLTDLTGLVYYPIFQSLFFQVSDQALE